MKKILSLILALTMVFCLASCGGTSTDEPITDGATGDLAYVLNNGKMVIGITEYEPMNFYDEAGNLTGFDTEFAEAVCEKLGVDAEFVEINWDNKFIELKANSIDCIWNGMTITDEVKLNASVTKPYVKNAQVVVMDAADADDYETVEDLEDLSFVAEAGSAGEEAIIDNGLDGDYVEVAAQTDALLEVASGSADACVIDITMANAMTGEGTSYDNLTSVMELTSEEYGVAFREDSNITETVNAIIDELKADGTLDALAEKYGLTLAL